MFKKCYKWFKNFFGLFNDKVFFFSLHIQNLHIFALFLKE
jgi:hypothetical protein